LTQLKDSNLCCNLGLLGWLIHKYISQLAAYIILVPSIR